MKTTLDLPDDLLIEAKAAAARRRTTLRAVVEHALRRELAPATKASRGEEELFETGPHGILVLRRRGAKITSAKIHRILEEEDFEAS